MPRARQASVSAAAAAGASGAVTRIVRYAGTWSRESFMSPAFHHRWTYAADRRRERDFLHALTRYRKHAAFIRMGPARSEASAHDLANEPTSLQLIPPSLHRTTRRFGYSNAKHVRSVLWYRLVVVACIARLGRLQIACTRQNHLGGNQWAT